MNLNASVIDRQQFSDFDTDLYKSLGFKDYKREIILYLKESKNLNGIVGHDLVTKVNGMIINYSIVDDKYHNCRVIFKTNYICDIEFPASVSLNKIRQNVNNFISMASAVPTYAFTNIYVIGKNNCDDLGLSMANLYTAYRTTNVEVVNISKINKNDEFYKFLIYLNKYDPKYYNSYDSNTPNFQRTRNIPIEELYDSHTRITCNTHGDEDVQVYINNNRQTGIYINKKIIGISEALSDLFNKYLFVNIEKLELIYSTKDGYNIKGLSFFMNFREDLKSHLLGLLERSINNWITKVLETKLADNIYVIISINNQFAIIDLSLIDENKRFVIVKPIYKLYGEFTLTEEVLQNNKTFANVNRIGHLNAKEKLVLYKYSDEEMDEYISFTEKVRLMAQEMNALKKAYSIGMDSNIKCLENDSFQSNQKP